MTEDGKGADRVTFSRGYDVCIMAIDGTWRRDCQLNSISDTDATLTVEGSIQGLNLKEFFLLLSSTGLAYRRCELVRVNGTEMDIRFLRGKHAKKKSAARQRTKRRCTEVDSPQVRTSRRVAARPDAFSGEACRIGLPAGSAGRCQDRRRRPAVRQ